MISSFCRADFVVTFYRRSFIVSFGEYKRQCCPFRLELLCNLRSCPILLMPDTENIRNAAPSAFTDINQEFLELIIIINRHRNTSC